MTLSGKLNIVPNGMITGGFVHYTLSDDGGQITYSGQVSTRIFFFSKTYPFSGKTKVDASDLLSSKMVTGKVIELPDVRIQVASVSGTTAVADVSVASGQVGVRGTVTLDLSKEAISVVSCNATGSVLGFSLNLIAHA